MYVEEEDFERHRIVPCRKNEFNTIDVVGFCLDQSSECISSGFATLVQIVSTERERIEAVRQTQTKKRGKDEHGRGFLAPGKSCT